MTGANLFSAKRRIAHFFSPFFINNSTAHFSLSISWVELVGKI